MSDRSELYISVDTETAGPIPGEYSLLSIGACMVEEPQRNFYIELQPLNENYVAKALKVSGLSLTELQQKGVYPKTAMTQFSYWIKSVAAEKRPVFVAFNATFDWMFTHWYFIKFLGEDPFGISGLDIKAYYMGLIKTLWSETSKKHVRKQFPPQQRHTHNALEDAIEQAQIFSQMLV